MGTEKKIIIQIKYNVGKQQEDVVRTHAHTHPYKLHIFIRLNFNLYFIFSVLLLLEAHMLLPSTRTVSRRQASIVKVSFHLKSVIWCHISNVLRFEFISFLFKNENYYDQRLDVHWKPKSELLLTKEKNGQKTWKKPKHNDNKCEWYLKLGIGISSIIIILFGFFSLIYFDFFFLSIIQFNTCDHIVFSMA